MGRSSEPYRPSKMGLAASDSELRLARYALQMSEHLTEGSESSFWPTATTTDAKASGASGYSTASGRHSGTTLTDAAVRLWPTPTARDGSGRGPGQSNKVQGGPNLMTQVDQWSSPQSGRLGETPQRGRSTVALNPEFVETLMGLPVGWTDCGYSETESSRSKPQSPSSSVSRGS